MDTVGDEVWKSVRLAWREELWLPAGVPVAAVAYALWIGLTGAAVSTLAGAVAGGFSLAPWTGLTDLVAVALALLWVLGPAALATLLVRDRVTNVRGNLATGYRLRHPLLLFLPPAVVLAVGLLALSETGEASTPVLAILVVGAVWLLIRTIAYAYRVFALAVPIVGHGITFLTAVLAAVAALVLGAGALGRDDLVREAAAGLAARTGVDGVATLGSGSVALLDVPVPAAVAAAVVVPVGLSAAYVAVQLVASALARLLRPTVRRPQLRTGQRYPAFARPTTNVSPSNADAGSTGGDATDDAAAADDGGAEPAEDDEDDDSDSSKVVTDVSHTRVYTPPDDAEPIDPATVAGGVTCPACGATLEEPPRDGTCPECGADL